MFGISHAMINYSLYEYLKNRYSNDILSNPEFIIYFSFISKRNQILKYNSIYVYITYFYKMQLLINLNKKLYNY
jgi:hypothetical protein